MNRAKYCRPLNARTYLSSTEAYQFAEAGAEVVAVLDTSRSSLRLKAMPSFLERPGALAEGHQSHFRAPPLPRAGRDLSQADRNRRHFRQPVSSDQSPGGRRTLPPARSAPWPWRTLPRPASRAAGLTAPVCVSRSRCRISALGLAATSSNRACHCSARRTRQSSRFATRCPTRAIERVERPSAASSMIGARNTALPYRRRP